MNKGYVWILIARRLQQHNYRITMKFGMLYILEDKCLSYSNGMFGERRLCKPDESHRLE